MSAFAFDRQIAALAESQWGLVARRQLLSVGLSRSRIQRQIAAGRLIAIRPGVYAAGYRIDVPEGMLMAAALACGPGSFISHFSAGSHWRMIDLRPGPIHVTTPWRGDGRKDLVLHRPRLFDKRDQRVERGVPVTSPERTLVDMAAVVSPYVLRSAVRGAERLELLDSDELARLCCVRRRGIRTLRKILAEYREPVGLTRSELERRFLELIRADRLPMPAVNVEVAGIEVDFWWPKFRLVVELDGYESHKGRAKFEEDRARDLALATAGCERLRFTWRTVVVDGSRVRAILRNRLLAAHG